MRVRGHMETMLVQKLRSYIYIHTHASCKGLSELGVLGSSVYRGGICMASFESQLRNSTEPKIRNSTGFEWALSTSPPNVVDGKLTRPLDPFE